MPDRRQRTPGTPRRPDASRRLPEPLTPDERRLLLGQPSHRYPTGVRNRAMIATMLYAGLRCSELIALRPRDVDLNGYVIRVFGGKGGVDRVVPIEPHLELYLREWRAIRPAGPAFFTTLAGGRIGDRYVRESVKRYGRKSGLERDVHPHLLRHTCATYWLGERGLGIHEVKLLMGHKRITTTERYLHAAVPDLVTKMRRFR